MSFGLSAGDIIAVSTLARSVWSRFRDSSDEFNAIQSEVAGLYLALDDIANNLSGVQVTDKQANDLPILVKGCRDVLNDTEQYLRKNESLGTESSGLGSKTKTAWRKLKWDPATVNQLRDRMVANATYLNAFNTSLASQVSRATNEKVEGMAQDLQSLKLNQSQQKREEVLQWISPLNFAPQQSDLSARRQEGTGSWLLESHKFQEWNSKAGQTLVCQGMPGAGKTMLTSLVIDHLQGHPGKEDFTIAYIYCDYRRQNEQTSNNLTASVAKQLLQHQSSIPENVLKIYQDHRYEEIQPSLEEVFEMIEFSTAGLPRIYLIVDALDELGNAGQVRQTFIGRLRPLQDRLHFNLMITSRYIPSLALEFHQPFCIDVRASSEDIRRYVQGHISDLANCVRKDLGLQEIIANSIDDVAQGMFLLAQLHMDSLRDKTSPKLIKKSLEILPKGSNALDIAYGGAMQRIENQREGFRLLAKQLLGWLTYSERLMTVLEVQHALGVEPGTLDMDQDNLSDVNEIAGFCAGLVIVDEETQFIRLVHYTTQDYFRRSDDRDLVSAREDIAISCLTYLLYDRFEDGWVNRSGMTYGRDREDWETQYPFLSYASKYWATHARVCRRQEVKDLEMSFAKDDRRVSNAMQVVLVLDRKTAPLKDIRKTRTRSPLSAMHFVAYLGYQEMILLLLDHGLEVDVVDSTHRTPLWWAVFGSHQAVVELLLSQNDVNMNGRGFFYDEWGNQIYRETPLGMAAYKGEDKIVELLIEREDVDVNLPSYLGDSPLVSAARRAHDKTVGLLLTRKEIEVNSKDSDGGTALCWAAYHGRGDVVKQLLKQENIQVNLVDKGRSSPLAQAVRGGHEGVVKDLLDCAEIDVNLKKDFGSTPLHLAAKHCKDSVMELLLMCPDIDVNLKNNFGSTPLHVAASCYKTSIMELLLWRADIDVNATDKYGQTPLHVAVRGREASKIELLLRRAGIDVNPTDSSGWTPLHAAVDSGTMASVRMLLGHASIKVNLKDQKGRTPLALGMKKHHIAVVEILIAHPDIDLTPTDDADRDIFTLVLQEKEKFIERGVEYEGSVKELEDCLKLLRSAMEARSRKNPQTLQPKPSS